MEELRSDPYAAADKLLQGLCAGKLYALLAKLYNAMVLSIAQLNQFNTVYSILLGHAVLGSVLGFNTFAAALAWTAFMAILGIVVIGLLKWLAAGALVGLAPVWAAAYLFPPLRNRVAGMAASLLAKLAVLGLVAAGMILVASMAPLFGASRDAVNLVVAYALPIVVPLGGHYILGQLGLGGLPGLDAVRQSAQPGPRPSRQPPGRQQEQPPEPWPQPPPPAPPVAPAITAATTAYRHMEHARALATT